MVLLETIGIFEETTYTVGIIFAGFVMMPFALGPGGNLMGMGVISLYCLVILPYKTDPELLKIERRQNMFLNSKWRKHVETLQSEMHDDDKGMRALAGAQNVCSLGHANADWAEVNPRRSSWRPRRPSCPPPPRLPTSPRHEAERWSRP